MQNTPDQDIIDRYLRHLAEAGHPNTTILAYRSPLRRAARELGSLRLLPEELQTWLATIQARNTRAAYANALRCFYRWCVRIRLLYPWEDPTAELPATRSQRGLPRPVSHDELRVILTGARQPYRLWCLIAAYGGLRCVEIARLSRRDITADVIYLDGKGDKPRIVPTHPDIWAAVAGLPPGPVAGCSPKRVSDNISVECQRRLGLAGVTAHRLRHWYGTYIHAAIGDVRVTQQLLGHASPTTTAVYTAVSDARLRAAVTGLPRITGASGDAAGPAPAAGATPRP